MGSDSVVLRGASQKRGSLLQYSRCRAWIETKLVGNFMFEFENTLLKSRNEWSNVT